MFAGRNPDVSALPPDSWCKNWTEAWEQD